LSLVRKQAILPQESESIEDKKKLSPAVPELNEISEVLKGRLYLSGCRAASADRLVKLGITAVVRAMTENEERILMESTKGTIRIPDHIRTLHIRLLDTESSDIQSHFENVSRFIDAELQEGGKVLVHCGAGISRSVTVIMAYLISYKNYNLRAAYALIKNKRKIVRPNNGFFRQLIEHERQTREDGRVSVRMIMTANGSSMPDIIFENAIMAKLR